MKNISNTFTKRAAALVCLFTVCMSGCNMTDLKEVPNPNAPSLDEYLDNPSRAQVQEFATGLVGAARSLFTGTNLWLLAGSAGRELVYLGTNDNRTAVDLLGAARFDPDAFYGAYYSTGYQFRRRARLFEQSANSSAQLTATEKRAASGFAKTWQAYAFLHVLNARYTEGIRMDVDDRDNPGPLVEYDEALSRIESLLQSAATDLAAGGDEFPFVVTPGLSGKDDDLVDGFESPGLFSKFTNALLARVYLYQGNYNALKALLSGSQTFISTNSTSIDTLNIGPALDFSPAANDVQNPLFVVPNTSGTSIAVAPDWLADTTAGDLRVASKVAKRVNQDGDDFPITVSGITGTHESRLFPANNSPIALIRNEELILMRAEARARTSDPTGAVSDINLIRDAANIGPYTGATTDEALINEILYQRRYSLWFEGHRWWDLRRTNRLNTTEAPLINPNGVLYATVPLPSNEIAIGGL